MNTIGDRELGELVKIDVHVNKLSREIPSSLGECQELEQIYTGGNFFHGNIPSSLSALRGVQELDLSQNNQISGKTFISYTTLTSLLITLRVEFLILVQYQSLGTSFVEGTLDFSCHLGPPRERKLAMSFTTLHNHTCGTHMPKNLVNIT